MSKKLVCLVLFAALLMTCSFALATDAVETTPAPVNSKTEEDVNTEPPVETPAPEQEPDTSYTPSTNNYRPTYTTGTATGTTEGWEPITTQDTVVPSGKLSDTTIAVINKIAAAEAAASDIRELVGDDGAAAMADAGITEGKPGTGMEVEVVYKPGQGTVTGTFTFADTYVKDEPIVVMVRVVVNGVEKWLPCKAKVLANGQVEVDFTEDVQEAMALSGEAPYMMPVTQA